MRMVNRSAFGAIPLLAILCLPVSAWAGRPLATEDADTVGRGVIQIEVGLDHARQEQGDRESTLTPVLTYGFADPLDLILEVPFLSLKPREGERESGLGDVEIRAKCRFLAEGASWPALAVMGAVKFPTGSERRELGSGETDAGVRLIGTKGFGLVTVHANVGYTVNGASAERNVWSYGLAGSLKVADPLALVAEVAGETNRDRDADDDPLELRAGLAWALRETLVLDGAVSVGLTSASPDYTLTVGLTARF